MEGARVKRFLKCCKNIGNLICWFVFIFWGMQALQKFNSNPVSSSISFTNGDDKHGNLQFPALTICLHNLGFYFEESLERHCPSHWIHYYYYYIYYYYLLSKKANKLPSFLYFVSFIFMSNKIDTLTKLCTCALLKIGQDHSVWKSGKSHILAPNSR